MSVCVYSKTAKHLLFRIGVIHLGLFPNNRINTYHKQKYSFKKWFSVYGKHFLKTRHWVQKPYWGITFKKWSLQNWFYKYGLKGSICNRQCNTSTSRRQKSPHNEERNELNRKQAKDITRRFSSMKRYSACSSGKHRLNSNSLISCYSRWGRQYFTTANIIGRKSLEGHFANTPNKHNPVIQASLSEL